MSGGPRLFEELKAHGMFDRMVKVNSVFRMIGIASATWNPASLADGAGETSAAITLTGAALGDVVLVAPPYDMQGIVFSGYVSAANTLRIRIQNESGGVIDLASGTWKVIVFRLS